MFFLSSIKLKLSSIIIFIVFLSSCLTIDSDLKINSNGSGTFDIKYSIDKTLKDISNFGSEDEIVPLNLSEEYIQEIIGSRTDIEYYNYKTSEDDINYIVEVSFSFQSIDALNSIFPIENEIVITRDDNGTIFTQGIIAESDEIITNDTLEIFKDIYGDHYFKLTVRTPDDIINVTQGSKIEDRIAIYSESFLDIIATPEKKSWRIRW